MTSWWSIQSWCFHQYRIPRCQHISESGLAGEGTFAFSSGQVHSTAAPRRCETMANPHPCRTERHKNGCTLHVDLTAKNAKDSQRTQSKSLGQRANCITTGVHYCSSLLWQVMIPGTFLFPHIPVMIAEKSLGQ